ncbi:MAG TPA: HAD family hydrolase, partial [Gemmatimonadales bacterium]|nr:HAD family hydrolase [Gemmatimonadales bacterium]
MTLTRDQALGLVHEYTASDALRKHMYAVEIAMRAMAARVGEDPDAWGTVGLLHDFDYERFP